MAPSLAREATRVAPLTPVLRSMNCRATRDTPPTPVPRPMDTRAARHDGEDKSIEFSDGPHNCRAVRKAGPKWGGGYVYMMRASICRIDTAALRAEDIAFALGSLQICQYDPQGLCPCGAAPRIVYMHSKKPLPCWISHSPPTCPVEACGARMPEVSSSAMTRSTPLRAR